MKKIIVLSAALFIFACTGKKQGGVFNGEVIINNNPEILSIAGKKMEFNDVYTGYMSVYDSLGIFCLRRNSEFLVSVFNLNSGDMLGQFCPAGRGPDDFWDFYHSEQYVVENNEIKLWGYDKRKNIYLLNLTRSIEEQHTVIDTLIVHDWMRHHVRSWAYCFMLDKDRLMISNSSEFFEDSNPDNLFPSYRMYEKTVDKELKRFNMYNRLPKNQDKPQLAEQYYSVDRINPAKNKIVESMNFLAQINILDIESGKLKGYRLKGTPDFDDLPLLDYNMKFFYNDVCVGEEMIMALYVDADIAESPTSSSRRIHIFDWDGNFIHELELDVDVNQISFDPVGKYLYGCTALEEMYRFDLNSL